MGETPPWDEVETGEEYTEDVSRDRVSSLRGDVIEVG